MYTLVYLYTLFLFLVDSKLDPTLKKQSCFAKWTIYIFPLLRYSSCLSLNEIRSDFEKAISSTFHIPTKWTATTGTIYIFPLLRYSLFLETRSEEAISSAFRIPSEVGSKDNLYFCYSFCSSTSHETRFDFREEAISSAKQQSIFYFNTLLPSFETRSEASNLLHISYSTMWKEACSRNDHLDPEKFPFLPSFLSSWRACDRGKK